MVAFNRFLIALFLAVGCNAQAATCKNFLITKSKVREWVIKNTHGAKLLSRGQMNTVVTVIRPFFARILRHSDFHSVYEQLYQNKDFARRYPVISKTPKVLDITFFPNDQLITDCVAYAHLKETRVCDFYASAPNDTRPFSEAPAESSRGLLYVPPKYIAKVQGRSYDYFAHEFGHFLHFNFMTLAEIKKLEKLYAVAMKKNLTLDDYAASNESEYLSQGLEAYFASDNKKKINSVYMDHTPSELKAKDPDLYAFIEKLQL